jgi:hypothetical protein
MMLARGQPLLLLQKGTPQSMQREAWTFSSSTGRMDWASL